MGTGPSCLTSPVMPFSSRSLTELKSSRFISAIFCINSQPNMSLSTLESSLLIGPSEIESLSVKARSSPTLTSSTTYKPCTLITMMWPNQDILQGVILPICPTNHLPESKMNPAGTGIKGSADAGKTVITSTSASYASRRGTPATSVHRERALHQVLDSRVKQPSWVQVLMWIDLDLGVSHAVLWSENASPLPLVPLKEF